MKSNFSLIRSNFFSFWKYNKQDRFGFSYFVNIVKQIDIIFKRYNLLLLDYSLKQNTIYIYFMLFNIIKEKRIFPILIYKIIFFLYNFVQLIYLLKYFYKKLLKFLSLFKKDLFFFYYTYLLQNFFINKKIFRYVTKVKYNFKNVIFKSNFIQFSILLNYELNKRLLFLKKLIFKNVFSINSLININWKYLLKNKIKYNKTFLNFNLNICSLLYIGYFTELFKNSSILLNYLLFLIYNQKQEFSKNIVKILKFFQVNLSWLLYHNFIYFHGLIFFLSGKFTNSMRKSRYCFSYGKISGKKIDHFISFSSSSFIIRAGLINFKFWIFF